MTNGATRTSPTAAAYAALSASTVLALFVAASPRAAATVAAIAAGIMLAVLWQDPVAARRRAGPTRETVACYAFIAYALLSALWSADVAESLTKPLLLLLFVAGAHAGFVLYAGQDDGAKIRHGKLVLFAILAAFALAAVESVSHQLLTRSLFTAFPSFYKGMESHLTVSGGVITDVGDTNIKRRLAAVALLVWPALLLSRSMVVRDRRRLFALAIAVLSVVMIYAGPSQSAWVAGAVSLAVFVFALRSTPAARAALSATLIAGILFALPLVWAAHRAEWHKAAWLPYTARHRVVIWNTTANEVMKAPFLGVGANATRRIFEEREAVSPVTERDDGTSFSAALTRHAHNAYVQTWYELGAVGALMLTFIAVGFVAGTRRLPAPAQPYALAQIAAAAAIMSSSYGIWQPWFLAVLAIGALALLIASAAPEGAAGTR